MFFGLTVWSLVWLRFFRVHHHVFRMYQGGWLQGPSFFIKEFCSEFIGVHSQP